MARDYKKIVAWQRAHEFTILVYKVTKQFPRHEVYGLSSQLRRAAVSTATNIVEGSGRNTKKDYVHFLHISMSSLKETEYLLMLSHDLEYLTDDQHSNLTAAINKVFSSLHGLISSVQRELNS